MASDFSRLMKQDFSDLEAASKAWRTLSTTMDGLTDRHRHKVTGPLHHSWKGDDADAALYYLEDVESRIGVVETEAMAIASTLDTTRFWMEQAQTDLRNAVRRAEEDDYKGDDEGWVSDPSTVDLPPQDPDAQQLIMDRSGPLGEYRARIDQAIADAHKASENGKEALESLNGDILTDEFNSDAIAESAQDTKAAMKAIGVQAPQVPKDDPKAAADWWDALSPEERQEYETLYPEQSSSSGLPRLRRPRRGNADNRQGALPPPLLDRRTRSSAAEAAGIADDGRLRHETASSPPRMIAPRHWTRGIAPRG